MSRLIDADALVEAIKGVEVAWYIDGNYTTYDDSTIMDIIEQQPTAYDVDKVVEQLEEKHGNYRTLYRMGKGNL